MRVLLEELNPENLSIKANKAASLIKNLIDDYEKHIGKETSLLNGNFEKSAKVLIPLCSDYWELKELAIETLKQGKAVDISKKIINNWKEIYSNMKYLDKLIIDRNNKYGTSIPTLEERMKIPIREEERCFDY